MNEFNNFLKRVGHDPLPALKEPAQDQVQRLSELEKVLGIEHIEDKITHVEGEKNG
jgi:hypothetical protein